MTTTLDRDRSRPAHRMTARRRRPPRWLRWVVRLVIALVVIVVLLGAALAVLVTTSPSVNDAGARVRAILAAHHAPSDDGVIPQRLATALLATEDSRFYRDPALDPQGVVRATMGLVTSNGNDGGATIEQQLAKLLYAPGTSVGSELRQVGVAFRFDLRYSKSDILAMYLDAAYFGDGAYGVTAAAEHYFGRPADQLSWAQASLLAGLVQAPSEYDPHGHLTLARRRQSHVLARLVATGHLTSTQAVQVWRDPLEPVVTFDG